VLIAGIMLLVVGTPIGAVGMFAFPSTAHQPDLLAAQIIVVTIGAGLEATGDTLVLIAIVNYKPGVIATRSCP